MLTSEIPIFDGTVLESAYVMATVEIEPGTFRLRRVLPGQAGGGLLDTDATLAANSDSFYPSQKAAKTYVDGSVAAGVAAEAANRAAADTTLQTNITNEATARGAADTTLQTNITAEAVARAAADVTLQTNLTTGLALKRDIKMASSLAVSGVSTWTARTTPNTGLWRDAIWCAEIGLWVAVNEDSTALVAAKSMTSPDGVTWTAVTTAGLGTDTWRALGYSPTLNMVVAVSGTGKVMTGVKTAGVFAWTLQTASAAPIWTGVSWSEELQIFTVVGASASMWSTDGVTWTNGTSVPANTWRDVDWANTLGMFVAVSNSGTGNRVMTSADGKAWTSRTSAADDSWTGVVFSQPLGKLCAVSQTGTVMTSTNGTSWTLQTASAASLWNDVTWSSDHGLFVAVAETGGTANSVMTSSNGSAWTSRTVPSAVNKWRSVRYSPQLLQFVAVGFTVGTTADEIISASMPTSGGRY